MSPAGSSSAGVQFEFATANRVIFGAGRLKELAPAAAALGRRALLVHGASPERAAGPARSLRALGVELLEFSTVGEPSVGLVLQGVEQVRANGCDMLIAIGGGSAIDAGKAIAALAPNDGKVLDYLEVVGRGKALVAPSLPFIAVPTTAGTGSEVTRNAVLTVSDQNVKVSLRDPRLLPRIALVDPELTYDAPRELVASSGMDALTQLIEPFVSSGANPLTDALCREGIRLIARSLRRAYADGHDGAARLDMSLAALLSGMALANAKLGAAHGFAGPIGGLLAAPHGAVCGRLLPYVAETNIAALRQRDPSSPALQRYAEVASLLTSNPRSDAEAVTRWLKDLSAELHIPPLSVHGMKAAHIPEIVSRSANSSSMKGNPVVLSESEMVQILQAAL